MQKTSRFESLNDAKFHTLESKELESVSASSATPISLDTVTITPSGGHNDGHDSDS